MREIKFRVWDKINGKHYTGYKGNNRGVNNKINLYVDIEGNIYESDIDGVLNEWETNKNRFEIMQYIGLKDNNGEDIYEGDVLQYTKDDKIFRKTVSFDNEKAKYEYGNLKSLKGKIKAIVIGNIHENKYLDYPI